MDVFCNLNAFKKSVLYSTKCFHVLVDSKPLCEGHLLIIPKEHRSCFQNLTEVEKQEYKILYKLVKTFLINLYNAVVIFEHGGVAQTVLHAHMHFLPTNVSIREEIVKYAKKMKLVTVPYLFYEYNNKPEYYKVQKSISPGFLHQTYRFALPPHSLGSQSGVQKIKRAWNIYLKTRPVISLAK